MKFDATCPGDSDLVVLIEQEPITRRRIQHDLMAVGYKVAIAKSLEKGAQLLDTTVPALILLDWNLEGSDRFLSAIVERPKLKHTFVICLGQSRNVMDRVQALNLGANEFLNKPILEVELLAKVQAGLRMHQMQYQQALMNQNLEAELEEAVQFIEAQFPQPLQHPVTIDFRFIPSQHLGGDCFDYFWIEPHRLALYLLDVSGHGMAATLMAIDILNYLRRQVRTFVLANPATVLADLNQRVTMTEHHNKYLTIWYGVYDLRDRRLTYASAGHPPAMLVTGTKPHSNATVQALKTPGLPIGLFEESQYQNSSVIISPNSKLYLYSDGVYEFPDNQGQIWGLPAFQSFIARAERHDVSLSFMIDQLHHCCRDSKFMDDLSLLRVGFT